jgi:hypothetical protein
MASHGYFHTAKPAVTQGRGACKKQQQVVMQDMAKRQHLMTETN